MLLKEISDSLIAPVRQARISGNNKQLERDEKLMNAPLRIKVHKTAKKGRTSLVQSHQLPEDP